jgi:plastocyanin
MKYRMLFLSMMLLATAGIFVISCGKSGSSGYTSNPGTGTPPPAGNAVSIKNMAFSPSSLSVTAGTTVTWTNNDAMTHTVTADDASFDSGDLAQGATYTHKFATSGTVSYHCKIHAGMTASVTVK